jgi:hypothetical protein
VPTCVYRVICLSVYMRSVCSLQHFRCLLVCTILDPVSCLWDFPKQIYSPSESIKNSASSVYTWVGNSGHIGGIILTTVKTEADIFNRVETKSFRFCFCFHRNVRFSSQKYCENNLNFIVRLGKRKVLNMKPLISAIIRKIRHNLMRKAKVFAKIRKRKLLLQLYQETSINCHSLSYIRRRKVSTKDLKYKLFKF